MMIYHDPHNPTHRILRNVNVTQAQQSIKAKPTRELRDGWLLVIGKCLRVVWSCTHAFVCLPQQISSCPIWETLTSDERPGIQRGVAIGSLVSAQSHGQHSPLADSTWQRRQPAAVEYALAHTFASAIGHVPSLLRRSWRRRSGRQADQHLERNCANPSLP